MSVPTNTRNPGNITASAEANGILIPVNTTIPDGILCLRVSGTYGTVVLTVRARLAGVYDSSDPTVGVYAAIAGTDALAFTSVGTGGTISLTDNTSYTFIFPVAAYDYVEVYASSLSTGTVVVSSAITPPSMRTPPIVNATTTTTTLSGATTITSTSANALAVGANGTTNPVLKVDASASSVATGISLTGAAAASGFALAVISSGAAENLTVDAKGTGTTTIGSVSTGNVILGTSGHTLTLNNGTGAVTLAAGGLTLTSGNVLLSSGTMTVTSASATALTVGRQGATSPGLTVDASTSTCVTGLKITPAAAAAGVALVVTSSGTDENLTINAKGAGTISLNATATGTITIGSSMTFADAKNIVVNATTGTKIGTATTQKLGFYNATPVVQPAANTDTTTGAAGGTTTVFLNTTYTGGGTAAYTVGGVVAALKAIGLLAP